MEKENNFLTTSKLENTCKVKLRVIIISALEQNWLSSGSLLVSIRI